MKAGIQNSTLCEENAKTMQFVLDSQPLWCKDSMLTEECKVIKTDNSQTTQNDMLTEVTQLARQVTQDAVHIDMIARACCCH